LVATKPTSAEIDKINDTTYATVGMSKVKATSRVAIQMLMHQLQVKRYPNLVLGGNFFQIFSRRPSRITSVVSSLVRRKAAKAVIT
jgi:hypothetical protein